MPRGRRLLLALLVPPALGLLLAACPATPENPDTRPRLPDGGYACVYVGPDVRACCNGGAGCGGGLWCNTNACACEDVELPCGGGGWDGGAASGTPDGGPAWTGSVDADGGAVDRLWFATTGDTRPGNCDDEPNYPRATIESISRATKALRSQFVVDLGDHMYVCDGVDADARLQMGHYVNAMALGPATWFMTLGNHECGRFVSGGADGAYGCFGRTRDANFDAYMAALGRPKPWYHVDVATGQGLARIVVIANDSWDAAQKEWLEATLAEADAKARYTIVARHQPFTGSRPGLAAINDVVLNRGHKYSLLLTAHSHLWYHGAEFGGRAAIIGLGGAPTSGNAAPGFATVEQLAGGELRVQRRDVNGNPLGASFSVAPQ